MDRITEGKWYYILNGWSAIPYGLILQWASAIWALPIYILSRVGILSRTAVIARIWYKIFVIIFLAIDTWQLGEIAKKIKLSDEKKDWLILYFLSSLLVMLPAVHIAQMDAVYMFFILMGIVYYLNDEYRKFLLCFMIAIPGKYMPLFIFVPLVLLKEKRYLYIFRDLFVGISLVLVDKVLNSAGYRIEAYLGINPMDEININTTATDNFESLLSSNFTAFSSQMSICVLLFALLCIYCYTKKSDLKNKLAIYVSFLGLAILFSFGYSTPYWIILIMPFILLLIFSENVNYNILLPMEVIFTIGFIYVFIIHISWIFGSSDTFDFLLFSLIPGFEQSIHGQVHDFIRVRNLDIYDGAFSAVMVACLIAVMFLTYPLKHDKNVEDTKSGLYLKGWYWVRMALAYGWIFLNIWVVALNHVW
jgi:hypothetical protein